MKVKTMIKKLNEMNPDAEVRIGHHDGEEVLFIETRIKDSDKVVWIESENNIDMCAELIARYENAIATNMDELDFYMELLEIGINIEMVRKYMDDEHADHMKQYCEEHGLI